MSIPKLPPVPVTSPQLLEKTVDVYKNDNGNHNLFEHGRSYVVGSSKVQHQLPAPSKLRPYIDHKAGQIETWPAGKGEGKIHIDTQLSSKPKLLQRLEAYLQKELRSLGCLNITVASEKRLQPYREVFEYMIENFRTYKPLLSSIKNEYEAMLQQQKKTIRDLQPLKAMLVNVNDQCEQKIVNLKQGEKAESKQLKSENAKLQKTITELREEIVSLQQQVKKCQLEIGAEYQKYRNEMDARKLLIQDINDLKYQQEELKKALSGPNDGEEGKEEDGVIIKIALRKAREELDLKAQKLTEVLTDYGDVVPRREFEKLKRQFEVMESEFEDSKKNNSNLMKEHSALLDVHKKMMEQRDSFALDCERMRESATPRPDWSKCGQFIEGGPERWREISTERSTSEKVDILIAELTGQDVSAVKTGAGMVDYFEPKGMGNDVPVYLHSNERVRNRRLNKRDLLIMIKDVWAQKISKEGDEPFTPHSRMVEYLKKYLQARFGVESMVVEWGYNIHDALQRYAFDKNVASFAKILNGEMDEDTVYVQINQLKDLFKALVKTDEADSGFLPSELFEECLTKHFVHHSKENVLKLVQVALQDVGGSVGNKIPYRDLFMEDDEGQGGLFVTHVRQIFEESKGILIAEIEAMLDWKDINKDDFKEILHKVFPHLDDVEKFIKYLSLAYRDAEDYGVIDRTTLLDNLRMSAITR